MALVATPDGLFAEAEWTLATPFQNNRSGWTGARRGAQLPGAEIWTASLEFAGVRAGHAAAAPIRAFLARLKGSRNSFRIVAAKQQHAALVTVQAMSGAVAGANSMAVQGLPFGATLLPAGSYMTVTRPNGVGQMVVLTAPLVANGAGQAVATFEPPLREAPTAGSLVETRNPFCEVTLSQSQVSWRHGRGAIHTFAGIQVEEVI